MYTHIPYGLTNEYLLNLEDSHSSQQGLRLFHPVFDNALLGLPSILGQNHIDELHQTLASYPDPPHM